jgi:hypothetical protein
MKTKVVKIIRRVEELPGPEEEVAHSHMSIVAAAAAS